MGLKSGTRQTWISGPASTSASLHKSNHQLRIIIKLRRQGERSERAKKLKATDQDTYVREEDDKLKGNHQGKFLGPTGTEDTEMKNFLEPIIQEDQAKRLE